jgi:hypothetical protein
MLTYADACKACGSTEWNFQGVAASEHTAASGSIRQHTAASAAEEDALDSKDAGEVRRCSPVYTLTYADVC